MNNITQKTKKFLIDHWHIIAICISGIIPPLVWFRDGLVIAGGDNFLYLDPSSNFIDYSYTWLAKINAGAPNIAITLSFPFMFFWVILKWLGLSLVNIERLWAILLFVLPGISIYYLVTRLNFRKNNKLAGFIAAIFYMFNMFVTIDVLSPTIRPVQVFLPILLYFWIKGLNTNFSLKYPVLISLTSLLLASTTVNLATNGVIFISFISYLIFYLLSCKKLINSIKFVMATGVLYTLVNLWWIVTSFVFMTRASSSIHQAVKTIDFTGSSHLLEAFRLMGFWAFRGGVEIKPSEVMPNIPYAHLYYEPLLLILTFSIPVLAFTALIMKPRDTNVLFFAILSIIGLFLVKGVNEPFGFFYKFFYENIPGFWIFREPFSKFTLINTLSFSVLLGFSVEAIYNKINNSKFLSREKLVHIFSKSVLILVLLIIIIASHPLITGKVIQDASWFNEPKYSLYVKVPEDWYTASEWLEDKDTDARILLLPKAGYGHCYNWDSGMCTGSPIAQVLLPNPIIKYDLNRSNKEIFIDKLYNIDTDFVRLLGLFNVKYILQQNDLDWKRASVNSPDQINVALKQQTGIKHIESFGKLDLYEVTDGFYIPRLYIPSKMIYIDGDLIDFDLLASEYKDNISKAIFVGNDNSPEKNQIILDMLTGSEKQGAHTNISGIATRIINNTPEIEFKKINPTKYQVRVHGADAPYILVFSESFHTDWNAYLETEPLEFSELKHDTFTPMDISYMFKKPIDDNKHFLVNGYANAWYIDPNELGTGENFTITLYFKPQSYFYIGLIISGLTFTGCVGYLLWERRKGKRKMQPVPTSQPRTLLG